MRTASASTIDDERAIDALVAAFYCAFDNRRAPADLRQLYTLMLQSAVVTQASVEGAAVTTLEQFIEPRRLLLCGGELTNFHEWEEQAATFRFGAIATRISRYRKEGTHAGAPYSGHGWKCFQLCFTQDGWRIAALSWSDARDGLVIDDARWVQAPAQTREHAPRPE